MANVLETYGFQITLSREDLRNLLKERAEEVTDEMFLELGKSLHVFMEEHHFRTALMEAIEDTYTDLLMVRYD